MSKASREREKLRNEKYGWKKETLFSKVCSILKKDVSFDEQLDLLNHMIIGSNENDWNLRIEDKKNLETFDKKIDLRNFSGVLLPSVHDDYLSIEAVGIDKDFYKEMNNNCSENEMNKLFDLHKIELNLKFKTPLGIARILNSLGKMGERIIAEN